MCVSYEITDRSNPSHIYKHFYAIDITTVFSGKEARYSTPFEKVFYLGLSSA